MTVTANYSNGSSKTVTGYAVSGFDSATAGEKTVTVTYTENGVTKTADFKVTVKEKPADVTLESIAVTGSIKAEYWVGEDLDTAGMTVTANYSNGSSKTVTGYTVSGFDSATAGEKTVTVTYTEDGVTKTAAFKVIVKEAPAEVTLDSITLAGLAKTEYKVGEALNTEGLVVTAHYSDGTSRTVSNYDLSGFTSATAGEKIVTVRYTEGGVTKTAAFTVQVKEDSGTGKDPGTSEEPGNSSSQPDTSGAGTGPEASGGSPNDNNAQTGDGMRMPVIIISVLLVASAGIAVVVGKKRRLG